VDTQRDELHCHRSNNLIIGLPPSSDARPLYHRCCQKHISSAGQLAPADTCYITISYEMKAYTGIHLWGNNNGPIHAIKWCHTLLNKCRLCLLQVIPRHKLPVTHSDCRHIGLRRCWRWVWSINCAFLLWTYDPPHTAYFSIMHFIHRSTAPFHSFHSAFYLPHSTVPHVTTVGY